MLTSIDTSLTSPLFFSMAAMIWVDIFCVEPCRSKLILCRILLGQTCFLSILYVTSLRPIL
jgi:hypothetical protein